MNHWIVSLPFFPQNSIFFDECDAIFLNYTWTADQLTTSALNSGDRLQDVFVGIDVFGRGMIGGGGYNTKEVLESIHSYSAFHCTVTGYHAPGSISPRLDQISRLTLSLMSMYFSQVSALILTSKWFVNYSKLFWYVITIYWYEPCHDCYDNVLL